MSLELYGDDELVGAIIIMFSPHLDRSVYIPSHALRSGLPNAAVARLPQVYVHLRSVEQGPSDQGTTSDSCFPLHQHR